MNSNQASMDIYGVVVWGCYKLVLGRGRFTFTYVVQTSNSWDRGLSDPLSVGKHIPVINNPSTISIELIHGDIPIVHIIDISYNAL